jgi:hypothetical protein
MPGFLLLRLRIRILMIAAPPHLAIQRQHLRFHFERGKGMRGLETFHQVTMPAPTSPLPNTPGLPEDAARISSPGTLSKDAFRTGPTA